MSEQLPGGRVATPTHFIDLLDLIGRRWTLRILYELRLGVLAFNELRARAGGLSQSVLVTRLTELFGSGLVADVAGGYELTARGAAIAAELERLASLSASWGEHADAQSGAASAG